METVISLPSYTIKAMQKDGDFLIKLQNPNGSSDCYQTLISAKEELFSIFEDVNEIVQYLKSPSNSNFLLETNELVLYTSGAFGKNRKYFELCRIKFQIQITLKQIIKVCEKVEKLTQKQIKEFIGCLATKIEGISGIPCQLAMESKMIYGLQQESDKQATKNEEFYKIISQSIQSLKYEIGKISHVYIEKYQSRQAQLSNKKKDDQPWLQRDKSEQITSDRNFLLENGGRADDKKKCSKQASVKIEQIQNEKSWWNKQNLEVKLLELAQQNFSDLIKKLKSSDKSATHLRLDTVIFQIFRVSFDKQQRCKGIIKSVQQYAELDINYQITELGKAICSFKSLIELNFSYNHNIFDHKCWDSLVNSLNSLVSLNQVIIRVKKGRLVEQPNWTQRLNSSIQISIILE